jgi:hypothetical protein
MSIFLSYVCWLPWIIECAMFKKLAILFIASVLMSYHYFLFIIAIVI